MKPRPSAFLAEAVISHASQQFDYIRELHDYLWRFVRAEIPHASGDLAHYVDSAVLAAEHRSATKSEDLKP